MPKIAVVSPIPPGLPGPPLPPAPPPPPPVPAGILLEDPGLPCGGLTGGVFPVPC